MQYAHIDTKRRDGTYVTFERLELDDDSCSSVADLRDHDEGIDDERAAAWKRGEWHYIGIAAKAHVLVVRNGHGTMYQISSAGLWGIESDSGEYLDEVFREQCDELLADMAAFANVTVER